MSVMGHSRPMWPILPADSGPLRSASDRRVALPQNDATCHYRKSGCHPMAYQTSSLSKALASFRSRVSKPSVNRP